MACITNEVFSIKYYSTPQGEVNKHTYINRLPKSQQVIILILALKSYTVYEWRIKCGIKVTTQLSTRLNTTSSRPLFEWVKLKLYNFKVFISQVA